jgi:hypothetical protein
LEACRVRSPLDPETLRHRIRTILSMTTVAALVVASVVIWFLGCRVPLFMERYSTTVRNGDLHKTPDAVVEVAYSHFVREPLKTFARDEVQRRKGLAIKEDLIGIGEAVLGRIRQYAHGSPFIVTSVVVGNVQYPEEVASAVSRKLAATQELERKDTEIEIERKERTKREVQAEGIANAEFAEPHGGLHSGRRDGGSAHRDVQHGDAGEAVARPMRVAQPFRAASESSERAATSRPSASNPAGGRSNPSACD